MIPKQCEERLILSRWGVEKFLIHVHVALTSSVRVMENICDIYFYNK